MTANKKNTVEPGFDIPAGHTEIVNYDGWDYMLRTAECDCRIWQLDVGMVAQKQKMPKCPLCRVRCRWSE